MKSDLCDKKNLMDALSKERESYAKLESDFKDLQAKYFDLKEMAEGEEAQVPFWPIFEQLQCTYVLCNTSNAILRYLDKKLAISK